MSAIPVLFVPRPLDESLIEAATRGCQAKNTRRCYASCLRDFFTWWRAAGMPALERDTVHRYRLQLVEERHLGPSRINQALNAIERLAKEAFHAGSIDKPTYDGICDVDRAKQRGSATGRWLSPDATAALYPTGDRLTDIRDKAITSLMVGAGARREEVATVEISQLRKVDDRWCLADVVNKGMRRTIPLPDWVYADIEAWLQAANLTEGNIFRRIWAGTASKIGESLTGNGIWRIATARGAAPHDQRRTFAETAKEGGADLNSLKDALGHSSLNTTQIYLARRPKIARGRAACDFVKDPRAK